MALNTAPRVGDSTNLLLKKLVTATQDASIGGGGDAGGLTGNTLAANVVNASLNSITPVGGTLAIGGGLSSLGKILAPASSLAFASLNVPHGVAPSAPVDGDMWTTTAGVFFRINGSTVGPLGIPGAPGVTSLIGTANEIAVSAATGAVTVSLPNALTFTGKVVTNGVFNGGAFVGSFNGIVGGVTPNTGNFTTLNSSDVLNVTRPTGTVAEWSTTTASGLVQRFNVNGTTIGTLGSADFVLGAGATDFAMRANFGNLLFNAANEFQMSVPGRFAKLGSSGFEVNSADTQVVFNSTTATNNTRLALQLNGSNAAFFGVAGSANGLVNGSLVGDGLIRVQSGRFGVSIDAGATYGMFMNSDGVNSSKGFVATGITSGAPPSSVALYQTSSTDSTIVAIGPNTSTVGRLNLGAISSNASLGSLGITSINNLGIFTNGNTTSQFNGTAGEGFTAKETGNQSNAVFFSFRKSDSVQIGSITRNALTNAVVYNTASDARMKEDVRDFTAEESGPLLDSLQPRRFKWKDGGYEAIGFIAQEEAAASETFVQIGAVTVGDDHPTEIKQQWQRYDAALIPIMVAEIKALRTRVHSLESLFLN